MITVESLLWVVIIVGSFGFLAGWVAGTVIENKLWLDAVCGREKIFRAVQRGDEANHG